MNWEREGNMGQDKEQKEREGEEKVTDLVHVSVSFSMEQEASAVITASFPFLLKRAGWIRRSCRQN